MSEVKVTFLGSGDAFNHGGRLNSCQLISAPGTTFMLDCGFTAPLALRAGEIDPNGIETILISHLHGDHFGGLPVFILTAQLHTKRTDPLTVVGPVGLKDRLPRAMEALFPGSSTVDRKFRIIIEELPAGETRSVNGLEATAFEGRHPSGAPPLAYRITVAGKTIAHTGDTEWVDGLTGFLAGADLIIGEAYSHGRPIKFHLSTEDWLDRLAELKPKRLILTHLGPAVLAHLPEIDIEAATDGLEIIV